MPILPDYDSPVALKHIMDSRGMAMQKKFGQNFLVHGPSRTRLIDALCLEPDMEVWEVGPGLGAMTAGLLERGVNLTAFEIDRGFSTALKEFFSDKQNFTLVEGDVLKTWKQKLAERSARPPARFFGNLPYNIAAALVADTIEAGIRFDRAVFTIQKEVALRMAAKPSTEDYSSFSVLCQWAYKVTPLMDLAAGAFWPRPNVTSRAVLLEKRTDWPLCSSITVFTGVQRALFSQRRKTAKNNLSAYLMNSGRVQGKTESDLAAFDLLNTAGIDPGIRAECLAVSDFCRLSDAVHEMGGNK